MKDSKPIKLEAAIILLRNWIIRNCAFTKWLYEYIFNKLLILKEERPEKKDLALIIWFYENHLGYKAFLRPENKWKQQKAGILIKLAFLVTGKGLVSRTFYFDVNEQEKWYQILLNTYQKWMVDTDKSKNTIRSRSFSITYFFDFMDEIGKREINELSIEDFTDFLVELNNKNYSLSLNRTIIYSVCCFLQSPSVFEKLKCNPLPLFKNIHHKAHERIPSYYSSQEVSQLLSVIDRDTGMGKFAYAVILLASIYGLRSIDIKELKFDSLHWKSGVISIVQEKTNRHLDLPIIPEVKFALLDYIKNARPSIDDNHVFIRMLAPIGPYALRNGFSDMVGRYFKLAKINTEGKRHGLHSLRHSLATKLSEIETPINQVADILGHSTTQSTLQYIWSDIIKLKVAAEEVPSYAK